MSALTDAYSAYTAAVAKYDKIDAAISTLTSLNGFLSEASFSFETAKSQINSCVSAVYNANIYIASFKQYKDAVNENKNVINETVGKINGYIGDVEAAIAKANIDLQNAQEAVAKAYSAFVIAQYESNRTHA